MGSLRNIFGKIQSAARAIIALCMIVMMTVIFVQTATRYVVFYSIPWSEEVSRYLYVTLTLLGLNLAMSSKQLVRIDIIDHKISKHALKYLNLIREALTVVITVVFFYSSFGMIDVSQYQSMYTILGLGFFLSACAALFNFCDAVKALSSNEE